MLWGTLERVPPRQRQDLLVGSNEVGHPSNCSSNGQCRLVITHRFTGNVLLWISKCALRCSSNARKQNDRSSAHAPVEMMSAWPVGLMLAFAHGSILTLAS